jgi:N6-L-threonylcarbamoyladenine synthase
VHTPLVIKTILAIETSCDETGIAVVEQTGTGSAPRFAVRKNVLVSQIDMHREFGGVVPTVAKREHIRALPLLLAEISESDPTFWDGVDAIAVTVCPGLEPALWAGITFAQELAEQHGKPLLGAHHMQGHLYSTLLELPGQEGEKAPSESLQFPAVALIVSGGHTMLLAMDSLHSWRKLGETRDDAVGEAYDKVARLLGLPYPGGPEIQKLAEEGDPHAIALPRPMIHEKNFDFSFSGLKTAVLYHLRDNPDAKKEDVAASFQEAAISVLEKKLFRAADEVGAASVLLAGGVAANSALRSRIASGAAQRSLAFAMPPMPYNTDNAAMIGAAAHMALLRGADPLPIEARGRVSM